MLDKQIKYLFLCKFTMRLVRDDTSSSFPASNMSNTSTKPFLHKIVETSLITLQLPDVIVQPASKNTAIKGCLEAAVLLPIWSDCLLVA